MVFDVHPIVSATHFWMADRIQLITNDVPVVVDMGGIGRLKRFLPHGHITDANIARGIDGCRMPYDDDSFEVAISISTLEHVTDQRAFLLESIRVAPRGIHWCPFGPFARWLEGLKSLHAVNYCHPCTVPTRRTLQGLRAVVTPFLNAREHILLLATLYGEFNSPKFLSLTSDAHDYGAFIEVLR